MFFRKVERLIGIFFTFFLASNALAQEEIRHYKAVKNGILHIDVSRNYTNILRVNGDLIDQIPIYKDYGILISGHDGETYLRMHDKKISNFGMEIKTKNGFKQDVIVNVKDIKGQIINIEYTESPVFIKVESPFITLDHTISNPEKINEIKTPEVTVETPLNKDATKAPSLEPDKAKAASAVSLKKKDKKPAVKKKSKIYHCPKVDSSNSEASSK